jgi:hypothetical protein
MALCSDAAGWARHGAFGDGHVRNAFRIMPVKTDRKDARGIAELMRLGWFRTGAFDGGPRDACHADRTQTSAAGASGD